MTRHGEVKTLKRLNTPGFLQIKRKHGKFFVNPSPGPHPSRFCLPLLHIVRDLLKIVPTHREAKKLIGLGHFMVDEKVVKDKIESVKAITSEADEKLDRRAIIEPIEDKEKLHKKVKKENQREKSESI